MDAEDLSSTASWMWDAFGKTWLDSGIRSGKKLWRRSSWQKKENAYKQRLVSLYTKTRILGNPKEICLDQIYTDVYALEKISSSRHLSIKSDKDVTKLLDELFGRVDIKSRGRLLDIVKATPRTFVIGKPGAGKSTFLKSLVLASCRGELSGTPIFIPIKQWHDSQLSLPDFISNEFEVCSFPDATLFIEKLLQSGNALVLFDGLDEVPNDQQAREQTIRTIVDFSRRYPSITLVLTCRTAAADYSFEHFEYVEVADFTRAQQYQFINAWYSNVPTAGKVIAEFNKREHDGLRDLAKTPLLLALLCLVYDDTLSFPTRRVELYQEATNALLRKWDSSRNIGRSAFYKALSHVRREQLLARLAMTTFANGNILISEFDAHQVIKEFITSLPEYRRDAEPDFTLILHAMESQHGLFVERAAGVYSFSHLTIHEYFCAKHISDYLSTAKIRQLITIHLTDDRWKEVIQLVASLLDDAEVLFDEIIKFFAKKFFSSANLMKILYACEGGKSITASLQQDHPAPSRQVASADLTKALDLAINAALLFRPIVGVTDSLWRLRRLIQFLQDDNSEGLKLQHGGVARVLPLLIEYLAACHIVLESIPLASLKNRERIVRKLVMPARFGQ